MRRAVLIVVSGILPMLLQAQKKASASYMSMGKTIYEQRCMTCHQVDGAGAQNMIPPLIKTGYVLGPKGSIIKILLNGMKGEIRVNDEIYDNEMPSQASLKDDEIAAVLTYIRKSFGNSASAVTIADVKKVRTGSK